MINTISKNKIINKDINVNNSLITKWNNILFEDKIDKIFYLLVIKILSLSIIACIS